MVISCHVAEMMRTGESIRKMMFSFLGGSLNITSFKTRLVTSKRGILGYTHRHHVFLSVAIDAAKDESWIFDGWAPLEAARWVVGIRHACDTSASNTEDPKFYKIIAERAPLLGIERIDRQTRQYG